MCRIHGCPPAPHVRTDPLLFVRAESQRRLHITCTDGCSILYHAACWRDLKKSDHSIEDISKKVGVMPGVEV